MDKQSKIIIEEAISCLNWTIIVENYRDYEKNGEKKRKTNIDTIKTDLRNLCHFIIENNISHFDQDQFVITWRNTDVDHKLGSKLEIMFVPTKACAFGEEERDMKNDEVDATQLELDTLSSLLANAISEENYELAAILRDRITIVNKELVPLRH